jgi:hypothetical protein
VDADLGLRLKPLVSRHNKADDMQGAPVGSWLVSQGGGGVTHWHPEPAGSEGNSSSSSSDGSGQYSREGSEHSGGSNGSDGSDGSESDSGQSEGPHDELQLHGGGQGGSSSSGGLGGWAVTLEGLKLDNVGVVEVVNATLQLSCSHCSSSTTVVLTAHGGGRVAGAAGNGSASEAAPGPVTHGGPAAAAAVPTPAAGSSSSSSRAFEWAGSCNTCRQELGVLLRPRFVHEGSNVLAGLKTVGCSPLDLLPSVYGATCADCDAVGALRNLQVGERTLVIGQGRCAGTGRRAGRLRADAKCTASARLGKCACTVFQCQPADLLCCCCKLLPLLLLCCVRRLVCLQAAAAATATAHWASAFLQWPSSHRDHPQVRGTHTARASQIL